jgi:hypothetical protein
LKIYNGNIGSYYDAEIKLLKNRIILVCGVLLGPVFYQSSSKTFNRPNNAGWDVDTPNFKETRHTLIFRPQHNVLGFENKKFHSGILIKDLNGNEIQASRRCPKKYVNKLGGVQIERSLDLTAPNLHWNGQSLYLPLSWLKLDRSNVKHVIATCFATSGGLWNVREFEIELPSSISNAPAYQPKIVAADTTSPRTSTTTSSRVYKNTATTIPSANTANAPALINKVTLCCN